ncbi:secreted coth spore-coat protein domain-containing protein [Phycomyces blakesleeanus]|uniref:Secreted coth spore-coat protein domain-containing protein n=1 Tax=Phycomyces blakesleeanus TaxID=4837 RepID=A0ABR3B9N3_PHYBL
MKLWTYTSLFSIAVSAISAADVQYSVVAFPKSGETVGVSVGGQVYNLASSTFHSNLFTGSAPAGDTYQYVLSSGSAATPETTTRSLAQGASSTGNEFYGRSKTVYDVPSLPQAYNPIYPTLFTNLNKSNEIATIIMTANQTAIDAYNKDPLGDYKDALVSELVYISNKETFKFNGAGLSTSGQSTKDFAKQSWAIDFNKYSNATEKALLYGRTSLKLRAEETDMTFAREKLTLDCLAAAGGATLSSSWVRVFINGEAYGLFLLMDDSSTHLIEDILYGGDWSAAGVGATYKGNALSPTVEGNLVYATEDPTKYPEDIYKLQDKGNDKSLNKTTEMQPLIDFTRQLAAIDPTKATDANNKGAIGDLLNPENTMIHLALNFLTGSWDGLWIQASNYYLNQDMLTKKYTIITYDFDEVFGNGAEAGLDTVAYTAFARADSQRPVVDAFIKSPYYNQQFQDIVKTIVKRFFKPSTIDPILAAWTEMLKEDIAWTRTIAGKSAGQKTTWTTADFTTNMNTTAQGTIGISQWVASRSAAVAKQLNFTTDDDLPVLGPYTGGNTLDSNGNVVSRASGQAIQPSGSTTAQSGSNASTNSGASGDKAASKDSAASTLVSGLSTGVAVAVAVAMDKGTNEETNPHRVDS